MDEAALRHGRMASHPREIPWRGWWDIIVRVFDSISRDNVTLISAGLAMYGLLAVFPGLAATVSLYGLLVTPDAVVKQIAVFSQQMPPGVWELLKTQLQNIASQQHTTLTISAVVSLTVAVWSASSGISSLMTATNVAYGERERRGLVLRTALALLLTIASVIGFIVLLALAFAAPLMLALLETNAWLQISAEVVRFLLLWGFAILALAIIYRLAPAREPARWCWLSRGSFIAATLWLIATVLFTLYVRLFASYQRTYGAIGSVVVLLMWFYLSSFVAVLGAEINAELERQTYKDTTTGAPVPMGQRGAYAADTIGPTAGEDSERERAAEHKSKSSGASISGA